jgi:indole-3-glycerol phosphate synthase
MILDEIITETRKRIATIKRDKPLFEMENEARKMMAQKFCYCDFARALSKPDLSFICEVKKASPSKGLISKDFRYQEIALEYKRGGADAVSVLTEPKFFQGDNQYLKDIKQIVKIPILRKDFILDIYQVFESKAIGADALLLICAILDAQTLKTFLDTAHGLDMDCLVEAHDEEEIEKALSAGAKIIGVNNRNLADFSVDINNSAALRKLVPKDKIFVSESGINTKEDIKFLKRHDVDAVLIGTQFMTLELQNIAERVKALKN